MNNKDEITVPGNPVPWKHFGELLRLLRESYPERVGSTRPGSALSNAKLSAAGLMRCLDGHKYAISAGAYSEIENGESIPKDPKRFLDAVVECLELSDRDIRNLTNMLGYDIVRSRLGEDIARRHFKFD